MTLPADAIRRIVYLGTPDAAVPPLRALHDAGYEIPLVVSRADTRRGRGGDLTPSPVKAAALALGIPVTTEVDDVLDVGADLGVVVAFGRIIKPHVLARLPMVNLHFSLLPRWRGAAPVERAILAGDARTGVCVMDVEEGLDTGGVHRRAVVDITDDHTLASLRAELVDVGTRLLVDTLAAGLDEPEPQVGEVTYADKIRPEELRIDWSASADSIRRLVRLGGAWTTLDGARCKIWEVAPAPAGSPARLAPGEIDRCRVGTGSGVLELVDIQPEGKPRRRALDWANGARLAPGARFDS